MKKIIGILLTLCLLFALCGCNALERATSALQPKEAVFAVNGYPLQLTADTTFQEKTGSSFDLQITNDRCYISVMAYQYSDLPQDVTPQDVYTIQNEDLLGKRDNVTALEAIKTQTLPGCNISYEMFSAEKDGVENHYATYLMDFPDSRICAWVVITATPSYMTKNRETLHNIACTLSSAE